MKTYEKVSSFGMQARNQLQIDRNDVVEVEKQMKKGTRFA